MQRSKALSCHDSHLSSVLSCVGSLPLQAVMTYNVGFFLAIVAGFGVGHFMFADLRSGKAGGGDACCPQP